jgi:enamine deaminase RidA (YjgF/YER057c/UK114 family)
MNNENKNDIISISGSNGVTQTDDKLKAEIKHQTVAAFKRAKENNEEIKNISKLIKAMEKSNKNNEKLSTIMLWLAVTTAFLAIVQVVIAFAGLGN